MGRRRRHGGKLGSDRQQATTDRVLGLLAAAHPGDPNNPASRPDYARLTPHVLMTSPLGDQRADSRQLMLSTVEYLNVRVDYRTSRQLAEALLERWWHYLGPEHPDTLTLAVHLAVALAWLEEAEQARALGEDTLERCRRVLGPDHPYTLSTATALMNALTPAMGWLDEPDQAQTLGQDTWNAAAACSAPTTHSLCAQRPFRPTSWLGWTRPSRPAP